MTQRGALARVSHARGGREDIVLLLKTFDESCQYEDGLGDDSSSVFQRKHGEPFTFARFKFCWRQLSFGILLHCCPAGMEKLGFLQELCAIALGNYLKINK